MNGITATNFIFDFGRVLTHFDPMYLTGVYVKDINDCKTVCDAVFDRKLWDRLDDGTITDEQVKSGFCANLDKKYYADAINAYEHWIDNLLPIDGMCELVKDLHEKGARLYLLSNISIGFAENYKRVPWIKDTFALFDGLVFSGPLHMTKPGKDIFVHLLEKYGLCAKNCVFIDDSTVNTSGAERVGIPSYLFDGDAEKLRKSIQML